MAKGDGSYLDTDLRLIIRSKSSRQVFSLGYLALGDVDEHRMRLKHLVNVLLSGVSGRGVFKVERFHRQSRLHFAPPRNHLVLVASNLETLPAALQADNRNIRKPYLIRRGEDRHD